MLIKKIVNCVRCGLEHINVSADPLTRPVLEDPTSGKPLYTHWAPCPTNGEPILVVELNNNSRMFIDTGDGK